MLVDKYMKTASDILTPNCAPPLPPLQLSLLIGDLSYADAGNKPSKAHPCSQDRWDAWGNIIEPLMSTQTVVPLPGNHEVEKSGLSEHPDFIAYQARGRASQSRGTSSANICNLDECIFSKHTIFWCQERGEHCIFIPQQRGKQFFSSF